MTPQELKTWMSEQDYTVRELAFDLVVHWTTPHKWLSGEMAITPTVERALQQLAGNTKAAARRRALRWTTADVRRWMDENAYTTTDLGYALDLDDRGVNRLLAVADDEPVDRSLVLALRGLSRERRMVRPKGMGAEEFRRWLASHRRTQKDVVEALGVSEAAVSRWASVDDSTHRGVSPMTRLALRTLERRR